MQTQHQAGGMGTDPSRREACQATSSQYGCSLSLGQGLHSTALLDALLPAQPEAVVPSLRVLRPPNGPVPASPPGAGVACLQTMQEGGQSVQHGMDKAIPSFVGDHLRVGANRLVPIVFVR
jgi:hypothetical protein